MERALDPLTWLPNRPLFEERLARAIACVRGTRMALALLFIDLDRFAQVNTVLGRETGDQVLRLAAARIARALGPRATPARLEGDDFAALVKVPDLPAAAKVAGEVLEHCREPYVIDCLALTVTASIGISLYPAHSTSAQALMERAERALYRAKIAGRNRYFPD